MLFRQLFDQDSSTYTYLLADEASGKAAIVDPVLEQLERDSALIEELELELVWALDTHVHADHVTALGQLNQRFKARSVLSERAGCVRADRLVKHGDRIEFGGCELEVRETPGHTSGCVSYVCTQKQLALTGDALLIRGCGRTDFQQGDSATLYRSVHEQLFSLPGDTLLYPAHDYKGRTATSVAEERRLNPRLGQGKSVDDFSRIMRELRLPYPKRMDVAVPSNLECGVPRPAPTEPGRLDVSWAPVVLSPAGVPEVSAEWLRNNLAHALVLDVREPDEYRGELGHVPGAELLPLFTFAAGAAALPHERPIVTLCRSGGRSGKAALQLVESGFTRVASLAGGMTEWIARSGPVEYGAPPRRWLDWQG